MTSGNVKVRMKYQKPEMRDLHDLTPVAGLCSPGTGDAPCTSGLSPGGTNNCVNGPVPTGSGCSTGDTAAGCSAGNGALS